MNTDLDIAVVGAGPSGLSAAYALSKAGRGVHVFEAGERVGGRMRTLRHDGYVIDEGAEMIARRGHRTTWQYIRELGIPTRDVPRVRPPVALWRDGAAHRYLAHPLGPLTGAGLSIRGRLSLLRLMTTTRDRQAFDPDRPENSPLHETTIAELAGRFGTELHDYMFQPVASAFFGWDTERCTAAPFIAHLRATGSSLGWRTYRDGMDTLARRLAERVPVSTRTAVREVTSMPGGARLVTDSGSVTARSVVLAVPAPVALRLHTNILDDERCYLESCAYVPRLRVSCMLDRPLDLHAGGQAHIVVFPRLENTRLNSINLDHRKCPGRAPHGRGLVTLLATPDAARELIDAPDGEVVGALTEQAEHYLPGLRAATRGGFVHRFREGMPEPTPLAQRLRACFLRRPTGAVEYTGDWLLLRPCSEGALRAGVLTATRVLTHAAPGGTGDSYAKHACPTDATRLATSP